MLCVDLENPELSQNESLLVELRSAAATDKS